MDKRQLTDMITGVFNSLTPIRVSSFLKDKETVEISIISNQFKGMTFSDRFKQLDRILSIELPELHKNYLIIYEAFTKEEADTISKNEKNKKTQKSDSYKESAKELE